MRILALPALIVAFAASAAFAQDDDEDNAARIVREAEEARQKSVEKALAAPARAFDKMADGPSAAAPPAPAAAPAPAPESGISPWIIVAIALPVGALVVLAASRPRD